MKPITSYFLILSFFKIIVGVCLLIIGWDSMAISGNRVLNLAVATILTFIPAAFAKPLFEQLINAYKQYLSEKIAILLSFVIISVISLSLPFLQSSHKILLIILLLILWTLVFFIEICLEKWFLKIVNKKEEKYIQKLSSISMFILQISTITGPFISKYLRDLNSIYPYYSIGVLCLTSSFLLLTTSSPKQLHAEDNNTTSIQHKYGFKNVVIWGHAMIWPAVAISNMVFPIIGKHLYNNSFNTAADFEITLGLSMGLSGLFIFATNYIKKKIKLSLLFIPLILATIIFSTYTANYIVTISTILLIGLIFGALRIELKSALAQCLPPKEASSIIASANAISAPLVVIFVLATYFEYSEIQSSNHSFHYSLSATYLIASFLIFLSIKNLKSNPSNIENL